MLTIYTKGLLHITEDKQTMISGWAYTIYRHEEEAEPMECFEKIMDTAANESRDTINAIEFKALTKVLEVCTSKKALLKSSPSHKTVNIIISSKSLFDFCTVTRHNKRKMNWKTKKGTPVANAEILEQLDTLLNIVSKKLKLKIKKVKKNDSYQEEVTNLARNSIQLELSYYFPSLQKGDL